jgi:short-subunit dehydrogenase
MNRGSDRCVVVSGVTSGIGRACAAHLRSKGYRVIGFSRTATGDPDYHRVDLTDSRQIVAFVAGLAARNEPISGLVNCAGYSYFTSIQDAEEDEMLRLFQVNLFGTLTLIQRLLPLLFTSERSTIVNISSIGSVVALPFQGFYSASKAALDSITEALRLELRGTSVSVVSVQSGDIHTPFTDNRLVNRLTMEGSTYGGPAQKCLDRCAADERAAPEPILVAKKVERILRSHNPAALYRVGSAMQRAAPAIKNALPQRMFENLMAKTYLA